MSVKVLSADIQQYFDQEIAQLNSKLSSMERTVEYARGTLTKLGLNEQTVSLYPKVEKMWNEAQATAKPIISYLKQAILSCQNAKPTMMKYGTESDQAVILTPTIDQEKVEKLGETVRGTSFFGVRPEKLVGSKIVLFKNIVYQVKGPYSDDEAILLAKDHYQRKRDALNWLRRSEGSSNASASREVIPEAVRREVWRRDGGRCVVCSSAELLEFDHIIPFSRGGANTVRNLQLLCQRCNRSKGAKI